MTQTTIQRPLANNDMDETGSGKNLTTPEFKQKLVSLLTYLQHHLQLQTMPAAVKLINSKKNSDNPFGLTGYYDHTTKKITLYITDRHDTDVLRSFAHEVIHHWQNERDRKSVVQGMSVHL